MNSHPEKPADARKPLSRMTTLNFQAVKSTLAVVEPESSPSRLQKDFSTTESSLQLNVSLECFGSRDAGRKGLSYSCHSISGRAWLHRSSDWIHDVSKDN